MRYADLSGVTLIILGAAAETDGHGASGTWLACSRRIPERFANIAFREVAAVCVRAAAAKVLIDRIVAVANPAADEAAGFQA